MKKHKYICISIIALVFVLFSAFNCLTVKKYNVIKVLNPFEIYVDTNNNGIADDDEKIEILKGYNVLTKDNYKNPVWKGLALNDEEIITLVYLTEKYVNDVLLDKKVVIKYNQNKLKLYVSGDDYENILIKSGYLFKECNPVNIGAYNKRIEQIKKNDYKLFNVKSNKYHRMSCKYGLSAHNYLILSKHQLPKGAQPCKFCIEHKDNKKPNKSSANDYTPPLMFSTDLMKVYVVDYTKHLIPNRRCNTLICNELINQIDKAKNTIDIAIYGYDKVPSVEVALKKAIARGVRVRLVHDTDALGNNIYKDTNYFAKFIGNSVCDSVKNDSGRTATYSNCIMHNKFFIFDNSTVLTGSANLSYTDLSDYNANAVVLMKSKHIAEVYSKEFEQMYNSNFHNLKSQINNKDNIVVGDSLISVAFSPKDAIISRKIIPLINSAKKYIYMPVFIITDKNLTNALIAAANRGVDVKVIVDATNAKNKYSTHKLLRQNKIFVKTENYAGKLHSKSIIIDDEYSVIGSMNFSKSGEQKNDENVIIIKNKSLAVFYKQYFNYIWSKINNYWLTHDVSSESVHSIGSCFDGIDNDYDGKTDLEDEGCKFKLKKLAK